MAKQNISVTEADIDDELMRQHAAAAPKTVTIKMPSLPKPHFKKPSFKGGKLPLVIALAGVLVVLGGGAFGYQKYMALREENARLANPQTAQESEANKLKEEVAKIIELPNENPTVATVVDVDKLKSQPFFASAQNGDRVLIFAQAKKAVLYRPGTKKIVEVAPINLGDTTANAGTTTGNVAGTSTTQKATTTPTTTTSKKQ